MFVYIQRIGNSMVWGFVDSMEEVPQAGVLAEFLVTSPDQLMLSIEYLRSYAINAMEDYFGEGALEQFE